MRSERRFVTIAAQAPTVEVVRGPRLPESHTPPGQLPTPRSRSPEPFDTGPEVACHGSCSRFGGFSLHASQTAPVAAEGYWGASSIATSGLKAVRRNRRRRAWKFSAARRLRYSHTSPKRLRTPTIEVTGPRWTRRWRGTNDLAMKFSAPHRLRFSPHVRPGLRLDAGPTCVRRARKFPRAHRLLSSRPSPRPHAFSQVGTRTRATARTVTARRSSWRLRYSQYTDSLSSRARGTRSPATDRPGLRLRE